MPELPEVETVRCGLEPALVGARIDRVEQRRPDLRFPFPERFVERLQGARIETLSRRAKYMTAALSTGETLIMHLGMTGRFLLAGRKTAEFHREGARSETHDHVVFHLDPEALVTYNDARRFGFMLLADTAGLDCHPLFRDLGVEPLGNGLNAAWLNDAFRGKTAPLKAALMDQRIVAGLGNIYVCEALFRAGLSPRRAAGTIVRARGTPSARAEKLVVAIRQVLGEAIEAGGSTLRDYAHADGSLGYFQHAFRVYDREGEPCPRPGCSGTIARIVQSNRSTFFCPVCQR